MLKCQIVPVTPYQQNCAIIWCDQTMSAAVIDPGGDVSRIKQVIANLGVKLEQIWITHGHLDHAAGAALLARETTVPIYGPHKEDQFLLDMLSAEARQEPGFGYAETFTPAKWLGDGDTLEVGQETFDVIHCPGHTPGHVVYFCKSAGVAFVGDVLFAGSIGRTDFPRGNHDDLIRSITTKLWPLGNEIVFVPGHGPDSTFGRERQSNPYVGGT